MLGAPVGLQAFEGFLYYFSETQGTLYKMDMFQTIRSRNPMVTGLPRTNDLKMFHPDKLPALDSKYEETSKVVISKFSLWNNMGAEVLQSLIGAISRKLSVFWSFLLLY